MSSKFQNNLYFFVCSDNSHQFETAIFAELSRVGNIIRRVLLTILFRLEWRMFIKIFFPMTRFCPETCRPISSILKFVLEIEATNMPSGQSQLSLLPFPQGVCDPLYFTVLLHKMLKSVSNFASWNVIMSLFSNTKLPVKTMKTK